MIFIAGRLLARPPVLARPARQHLVKQPVLHGTGLVGELMGDVQMLLEQDGLPEIAREIMDRCKPYFRCFYEEKDAIGKRYRRMDAIGTPFCVTIDHQTKEDNTVTIRFRDTMLQERVAIHTIKDIVDKQIS